MRRKNIIGWLVLLIVIMSGIGGLQFLIHSTETHISSIEEPIITTMRIHGDDWIIEYSSATTNNTVYTLLLECASEYNFTIGSTFWQGYNAVFINSINGAINNADGNNLWWQYYVNGGYGEVGCDKKEIFDGDFVEWKYEKQQIWVIG